MKRLLPSLATGLALLGAVLVAQGLWLPAKAALAQILLERAFARTLLAGAPVRPWSWADVRPVARLEAPRLQAGAIVLAGGSGQALAFGPGHLAGTPQPGEPGVAVYAGHRDTHFAFLAALRPGDELRVVRAGGVFRFRATHMSVVRWDASGLDPLGPGRRLVLAACWPLDARTAGPLRYLVHAELIEDAPAL